MAEIFRKLGGLPRQLHALQDNIAEAIRRFSDFPVWGGVLLENVALDSSATNNIAHGLGREFLGFIVLRIDANTNVWEDTSSTRDPSQYIPLSVSTDATATIWVY